MKMGFRMPTQIVIGAGCRTRLPELLAGHQWTRVLLVVDPGLLGLAWFVSLRRLLESHGLHCPIYSDFSVNPRIQEAERTAEAAWSASVDAVIAIGGGSAIDTAKAAAMLATNPGKALDFVGCDLFPANPIPLIAVPTTCGTGSEVTWVSVLTDEGNREKVSIKGAAMFPAYALVDPDLLETLPVSLLATTAMDALTHAVEALVGRRANPVSDALAAQAVALVFKYLEPLVESAGADADARFQIAKASCLAGMAFGNADVAGVHCLSESIGALFDVPHGLANAVLLAPVLRYQSEALDERLDHAAHMAGICAPGARRQALPFLDAVVALADRLKIPAFNTLGITPDSFDEIAGLAERNGSNSSNPREMRAADYRLILDQLAADA